jgi:hypothetical protein
MGYSTTAWEFISVSNSKYWHEIDIFLDRFQLVL